MGNCCSSKTELSAPPRTVGAKELKRVIKKALKIQSDFIFLADRTYNAYEHDDIVEFLRNDLTNKKEYLDETFDCDDFSLVLSAASKKWSSEHGYKTGMCFGLVWGDIRTDEQPNPHAVNFFVDADGVLWLVEPQSDKIFKPTANSTFWMCMV